MSTGFPFLDDPGPVLAFAHRGGARHPDLPGLVAYVRKGPDVDELLQVVDRACGARTAH